MNSHSSRTRRQAWPDGRGRARARRLRPQLPAAPRQGAARHRSQQEAFRRPARPARNPQPRTQGRGAGHRRKAERPDLHHHPPGRRIRASSMVRSRPATSPRRPPPAASRSSAIRSSCIPRSRRSACTRRRCICIRKSMSRSPSTSPVPLRKPSVRPRAKSAVLHEETNMADLGLEIGAALAEAGDVEM